MSESDRLEEVYLTYSIEEAEIVRLALQNQGYFCALDNANQASLRGIFPIKILVPTQCACEARQYLEHHRAHRPEEASEEPESDE